MSWPKQVPVLKPEDFVIGPYQCEDRFCLIGWKHQVFHSAATNWSNLGTDLEAVSGDGSILDGFTPNTLANRRRAARIWLKFIKRLGYTEDGPTVEM